MNDLGKMEKRYQLSNIQLKVCTICLVTPCLINVSFYFIIQPVLMQRIFYNSKTCWSPPTAIVLELMFPLVLRPELNTQIYASPRF